MAYSSGTFSLIAGNPVTTGTTISSNWANDTLADLATNGLTLCMLKNGTQTVTANIPFAGFRLTGIGAPTATGDALREGSAIGGTTPAAITGTTLTVNSVNVSTASPLLLTNGQLVTVALTPQTVGATTLTIPNFASVVDEFTFKTKSQTMSNKTFVAPALGTPVSGVLTNCTGYTVANISGAGTGVLTALAVNIGSAGAFVTFNGALGTPSSGTLSSATGLPISTGVSGLGTGVATLLSGTSSGGGGPAGTTSPDITTSITTPSTTFAVFNATATTVNAFGGATTITMGATTGTMTVRNTTLAAKAGTFSTTLIVTGASTHSSGVISIAAAGSGSAAYRSAFTGNTISGIDLADTQDQSGVSFAIFRNSASGVTGSITRVGVTDAVAYNTTSDYRVKKNIIDLTGSGAFIDGLRPRTFKWKSNNESGTGFIAHEVQIVSPSSVSGGKDDIDSKGDPKYQGMMPGSPEIIANIVSELQSIRTRVATIEQTII